jgi:hypothetical protein
MADFTTTTHDAFVQEIWSDESFMTYESNLVVSRSILVTSEVGKGNNKGDVLRKPRVSDVTAQDIPDNADISGEANTETQATVTLNKKKHASVYIQKHLVNNLVKYDLRQPYTHKIGYALAKRTDLDVIATLQGIASPNTVGTIDASATDVTEAYIKTAMEFLDVADIPMEDRSLVFYPDQRQAVLGIARFSEWQTMGPGNMPIRSGKVIPIFGMPTDFSTTLTQLGTSPNFYRAGYLLHKEAVWLAKPGEMDLEFNYVPRRKAWLLSGDLLYGSNSLRGTSNFVIIYTDN